ncbi:MAG TPA: hypothetical protein VN426_05670 [Syntrophomonadaceae bacterium]|nr:hypothetical protein [Syntrophomonadaceae bacterium]
METTSLQNIHRNWNSLEPDAVTAGLSVGARDNFEMYLDELTKAVSQQKMEDSFLAAISLYDSFGEIAKVLKMPLPSDFFKVKYQTMAALVEASRKDWKLAESHANTIDTHWNQLRLQAKSADPKLMDRTEFSLHDIQQAIKSQSLELVAFKGEIAMSNLKQLEEALSKPAKSQGQSSGSQGQQSGGQGQQSGSQNQ